MTDDQSIEACARAAHETNRVYCITHGDMSQSPWETAPPNIRASAIDGVKLALGGATPEQQHENWLKFKIGDGWVFGPVKDAEKKAHPCLVPYGELPEMQRQKDVLYVGVVRGMAAALGMSVTYPAVAARGELPAYPTRTIDWSKATPSP